MEYLIFLCYLILAWYASNILWICLGFSKVKSFHYHFIIPKTKFSIVVPYRNEKENLPKLLASFEKLNYPADLFEVILVDDESDVRFQISDFRFRTTLIDNIRKTKSPKKDAINTAISLAQNDWIITTDADCVVNANWLATYDAFIQQHDAKMIASGVIYEDQNSFLKNFQLLDLLSLQGVTIGSFGNRQAFMCNGANFCYQKAFFNELNGFEGNDKIASGDDVFLLQKAIEKEPKSVHFIKNPTTIVLTKPETSWQTLFHQRVRWASKTGNYKSIYSKQLGLSVFSMNLLIVCSLLFIVCSTELFVVLFAIKFLVDYILFRITSTYFEKSLRLVLLSSLFYAFFSSVVVVFSLFRSYTWKGRSFKK